MPEKPSKLLNPVTGILYQDTRLIDTYEDGSTLLQKIVTFTGANDWLEMYHSPASAEYTEPMRETAAGMMFEQQLALSFPGDDISNHIDLVELINKPLIINMVFPDGESKLLGSQNNPVFIQFDHSTNPAVTGFKISFSRRDIIPAPWLEIESAPPPGS